MSRHLHLVNRNGIFHWRRRLPGEFASAFGRQQLLISPRSRNHGRAAIPDEDAAIVYFRAFRWKTGKHCPYCGNMKFTSSAAAGCGSARPAVSGSRSASGPFSRTARYRCGIFSLVFFLPVSLLFSGVSLVLIGYGLIDERFGVSTRLVRDARTPFYRSKRRAGRDTSG